MLQQSQYDIIEYHCVYQLRMLELVFLFPIRFRIYEFQGKKFCRKGQKSVEVDIIFFGQLWSGFLCYFIRIDKTGNTYIDTKTWSVFLFCKYFRYVSLFSPHPFWKYHKYKKNALHLTRVDKFFTHNLNAK